MQVIGNSQNCIFSYFIYSLLPSRLWLSYSRNQWNWRLVFFLQFFHPKWLIKIDLRKAKNFFIQSFYSTFLGDRITLTSMNRVNKTSALFCALAEWLLTYSRKCVHFREIIMCWKNRDVKTIYLQDISKIEIAYIF